MNNKLQFNKSDLYITLSFALLYLIFGKLSFFVSVNTNIVTLVIFAAEGFSLAGAILYGRKVALGVFLGQLSLALINGLLFFPSVLISFINAFQVYIASYLFKKFAINPKIERYKDAMAIILMPFLVLQIYSASLGTLTLWSFNIIQSHQFVSTWFSWWLGNSLGQVIVVPFVLSLLSNQSPHTKKIKDVLNIFLCCLPILLLLNKNYFDLSVTSVFALIFPIITIVSLKGGLILSSTFVVSMTFGILYLEGLKIGPFNSILDMNIFLFGLSLTALFSYIIHHQLNISKKVAEQLCEAKSTFLANMSHELRTPLTTIIGYSDLALDEIETNEFEQKRAEMFLKKINQSGKYLHSIVNDILDYSKIEAQKIELTLTIVGLDELLDQIDSSGIILAKKKGNRFKLLKNITISQIKTDPLRLKQILLNLISNSAKFTQNGEIILEIDQQTYKNGEYIAFKIIDTGSGMDGEQLKVIFDRFTQVHDISKESLNGTGLGLAITKELIHLLEGEISVQSEKGKGTAFTVTLPLKAA